MGAFLVSCNKDSQNDWESLMGQRQRPQFFSGIVRPG